MFILENLIPRLSLAQYVHKNPMTCARFRASAAFIAKNPTGKMNEQDLKGHLLNKASPSYSIATNLYKAVNGISHDFHLSDQYLDGTITEDAIQKVSNLSKSEADNIDVDSFVKNVFEVSEGFGKIMHPDSGDHRDEELLLAYAKVKLSEMGVVEILDNVGDLKKVLDYLRNLYNDTSTIDPGNIISSSSEKLQKVLGLILKVLYIQ